ncbi:MAG TPA: S9 family peptidase [Candidatus Limnocylindrales bacterium]|nr:S9 family peptidase [Candidatus Limnocylindrales bacterium]
MKARFLSAVFAILLLASPLAFAAPRPVGDSPAAQRLTPEQALNLRRIFDLRFSPHGARLAFTVAGPPTGVQIPQHIWIMDVATRQVRQYTFSAKSDNSPRWSPDGKFLAFLSNRDNFRQIYLMPSDGGDAYPITTGKRNIASFAWSPDGKQIVFLAPDAPTAAEEKKKKNKDDAIVVDHDTKYSRVWILDVAAKKARALTGENWQVTEARWTPDGRRLIVSATDHPASDDNTNRIFSIDAATGKMTLLVAPKGPFGDIRVSPDGTQFAYVAARVDGPEPTDIYVRSFDSPTKNLSRNLTAASIDRPMFGFQWYPDGSLMSVAENGFNTVLYSIGANGSAKTIHNISPNPLAFAVSPAGTIAFVGETATAPPEIYLAKTNALAKRVTHLNASWDSVILAKPSFFHYHSFDGLEIEGELLKSLGNANGSRVPLVVLVHGGPTGAWHDSIDTWGQLLAAHGFAVAYFNIRGSTGYGEKFMEMNRADWGGADFKDVMAGVDYLIKQGIADPNRLGIGGWSYGGYMAEWAITQTNRFKAAVSGAGMVDLIAEFSTENGPSYDKWFWGLPYDHPERFLKHSPLLYLKNAHTPILILQGQADTTDPLGQSTGLYRGLKFYGAPAELVEYPRENHGFHEQQHMLDRLNRIVAWYEKYLK